MTARHPPGRGGSGAAEFDCRGLLVGARVHGGGGLSLGGERRLKLVEPDGRVLGPGEIGHLCIRGHVTSGYYQDDAVNRESFEADGYLKTGDLCSVDADSRVRYHGRIKDLLKVGGVNVSPVEIESALLKHPSVRQAHVFGQPHVPVTRP